jgi:molybdopterin-guanine dinucleotide biosynthesis protein A
MLPNTAPFGQSRAGFILAGGKSSRMGKNQMGKSIDKVFLQFEGKTLLARALAVASTVCDTVEIVGDPAKFAEYGIATPVVADVFPGCGPLAGIHAALASSSAALNLMLAVDMPFVSSELLAYLFTMANGNDAVVTVPRAGKGLQPLCAVYRREFAPVAEEALAAGKYKIDAAFSKVPIRVVDEDELAAAGFSEKSFANVNTPEDWQPWNCE